MTEPLSPDLPFPSVITPIVGGRIGRYVLLERIAEGGMGVVYAAYDSELDRKVAIKILRPLFVGSDEAVDVQARLLREAQAMARLSHPNVVAVHDVGTHEGSVYIAMEYVGGGTLKERLRQRAQWRERLALLKAAGAGLAAAHAAGLIHRDFKPDNVLVGEEGRVRVTDFGIARAADDPTALVVPPKARVIPPASAPISSRDPSGSGPVRAVTLFHPTLSSGSLADPLTMTGTVLGTIGYMAPEQAFGEHVDARSDQFSFCATLYAALYGEKPYGGDDLDKYLRALSGPVREAPAGSKVPAWLRRIVLKGLSPSPEDRYASMTELLDALDRDPALRRRRWLSIGGAVAAAVLAVAGYAAAERREDRACATAADLSGTWDPLVREDVRRAFEGTGAPGARDSFERAAKALDAYAATWGRMTSGICEVTKGRDLDEMNRLRAECLDRAKNELRGLTAVFARADTSTVDHSVAAAYGLTALSSCDDVAALRASPGLPADPKKRAAVQTARAALAEASSLGLAGKSTESLAEAQRALAIAREAGHRSTEAEALFFVAHNRQRMGDYERAAEELGNAMAVAYGAKDDVVMMRTASDLAFVQGDKLYRPEDARRTLALANAGLERVGGGDELEGDVLSTEALLLITGGHADQGIPMLERVVRIDQRVLGETPTTAIYMNDLGYARHLAGKNEDALVVLHEAQAMLERIYGADKFDAGIPYCNMGASSLALGRRADADGFLHHALDLFDRENPDGFWSAWTLQYLSLAAMLDGDITSALALGRRGVAIADRLPSSLRLVPGVAVNTPTRCSRRGRPTRRSRSAPGRSPCRRRRG
jgi:tetratricopeptide (TPR) repeat protein